MSSLHMHFTNRYYGILYNKIQVDKILDLEDFENFVSFRWLQARFSKSGSETESAIYWYVTVKCWRE